MNNAVDKQPEALKDFMYNGAGKKPEFIVYTDSVTNRLTYVCRFLFQQGLICNFVLTDNEKEFSESTLIKINYSGKNYPDAFHIQPSGLLSETGVREFVPPIKNQNNTVKFYPTECGDCDFDIFSAIFYLISRYVEWQKFVKDNHGRFEILNSILYKISLHKLPVIENWLVDIKLKIQSKFPGIKFESRPFKFVSTIDVDNVYAFKAKPFYRNLGGGIKDFLRGDFKMFSARIGTVLFGRKDPFDAYDYQVELSEKHHVPLIYFFLYSNHTKFDRTIQPNHRLFKKLLYKFNARNVTYGLHPSYLSSDDSSLLKKELTLLNKNSGKNIVCSRQHYLRFNIRTTPVELFEAGIKYDFSMGYASGVGFRAGTSLPFYYYDFKNEKELEILMVPFVAMDGAFYIYDNISLDTAKDELLSLAQQLQRVNGLFITVFHDRSFSKELYPGWKELYFELHKHLGKA